MRITLLANPDKVHARRWIEFLAGRGHTLTLITDPFNMARPRECSAILIPRWNLFTNILAYRLTPKPYGNDLWKHLHYRPLVRASRPDVVHGLEAFNNGLATAWAGPYPRVLTPWGKDVHHDAFASRIGHFIISHAVRGVEMISTNDETMPQYLNEKFGVPRERVKAFTWGVDLDVFAAERREEAARWRQELAIPEGAPVILSPRNFDPYWGLDLLLEAAPAVLRERPEAVFVLLNGGAGNMPYMAESRRRVEAEGWAASARFVERVLAPGDLSGLYNLSAAFVSAPRTDLLAQTILEGMACGCLPVLADHAAYRKHARHGANALIMREYTAGALAGALLEALRNNELREAARREGPRIIATHENWKINALKMEEVYAEAIERFNVSKKRT